MILLAISLSLDAFALSVAYGLLNISKEKIFTISVIVGLFHFFMPILGMKISTLLINGFSLNIKPFLIIILFFIIIEMINPIKTEDIKNEDLSFLNIFLFALVVSIDSFFSGAGLILFNLNIYLIGLIFMFFSSIFTFLGFILGKFISKKFLKNSKCIGICLVFVIFMYIICKY